MISQVIFGLHTRSDQTQPKSILFCTSSHVILWFNEILFHSHGLSILSLMISMVIFGLYDNPEYDHGKLLYCCTTV